MDSARGPCDPTIVSPSARTRKRIATSALQSPQEAATSCAYASTNFMDRELGVVLDIAAGVVTHLLLVPAMYGPGSLRSTGAATRSANSEQTSMSSLPKGVGLPWSVLHTTVAMLPAIPFPQKI